MKFRLIISLLKFLKKNPKRISEKQPLMKSQKMFLIFFSKKSLLELLEEFVKQPLQIFFKFGDISENKKVQEKNF